MADWRLSVVLIGPFGLSPKGTMRERALPLGQALVRRGHRVTMLLPPWDNPADSGRSWDDGGVRVVNVPLPPRLPLLFHLWLTLRLVRAALALRPEVVHLFKPKAYAGLSHLALWWLRRWGRVRTRLVVDEDDWEIAWNELEAYSWAEKKMFAWQEAWGLRHADAVTVASRALESLVQGAGVAPQGTFYVPNGVRPPSEAPAGGQPEAAAAILERHGLAGRPVILLYTRFFEYRVERLFEVMQHLAERAPQARWLVAGRGLFGEEAHLAGLLARAGLSDRVVFAGWVPRPEVAAYFAAATLALHLFDDTLVNRTKCSAKLIDLLAGGVPVVATAVGQNVEYIRAGETGLLVPPDDVDGLVEAIVQLLADDEGRRRLGAAAARWLPQQFAWDRLVIAVEEAYRRC